jgi:exonuclease I
MPVSDDFLAFLDTETGGLEPGRDPVIEVATILTDLELNEVGRFCQKIQLRPGDVVSPEAARLNGYDPDVWAREAVPMAEYRAFLSRNIPRGSVAVCVGHNVPFDRDMIDKGYYKPTGLFCPLSYHKVDTVGLAMALKLAGVINTQDVKLTSVSRALKIEHSQAHTALSDCLVAKEIFERTVRFFKRAKVMAG